MALGWIAAARNSAAGLAHGWRKERPVRQEIVALVAAIVVAPFLARSALHGIALVGVVVATLVVELLNVGLESICDRITTERDEHVRIAKDSGSAAVTLTVIVAAAVWLEAVVALL